jgi:hypothetical protein
MGGIILSILSILGIIWSICSWIGLLQAPSGIWETGNAGITIYISVLSVFGLVIFGGYPEFGGIDQVLRLLGTKKTLKRNEKRDRKS